MRTGVKDHNDQLLTLVPQLTTKLLVLLLLLGLDHGRGAKEVVDLLELERISVVPLTLIVIRRLEFLDIRHIHDVSLDTRKDNHSRRLELALEPHGSTRFGGEDRATSTREEVVDVD